MNIKKILSGALAILTLATAMTFPAKAANNISISLAYNNVGGTFAPKNGKMICCYNHDNIYSDPVICDLEGDGKKDVVFCNTVINVADAATGKLKWRVKAGHDRSTSYDSDSNVGLTFNDAVVKDIDADGKNEIITCHGNGWVSVLDHNGYFENGWPKKISTANCSGVAVGDTNNDGKDEIAVALAIGSIESLYLLDCRGNVIPGWPQLSYDQSYKNPAVTSGGGNSYGIFKGGIAMCDADGDGDMEVVAATDTQFAAIYQHNGRLVRANPDVFKGRTWSEVVFYTDGNSDYNLSHSNKWGAYYLKESDPISLRHHAALGHSKVTVDDLDGDGTPELLFSGVVVDAVSDFDAPSDSFLSSQYMTFFIMNTDRTRFKNDKLGYDWTVSPGTGIMGGQVLDDAKLSMVSELESVPVVADLDGDGVKEVLLNTYDCKLHCFSLTSNKKEMGNFPFKMQGNSALAEFASKPVCVDINCDGKLEVIFGTFTRTSDGRLDTGKKGRLVVLDCYGNLLCSQTLPDGYVFYESEKEEKTNTCKAGIAVDDMDGDGEYEVAVSSTSGSLCVFNLKGSTTEKFYSYHCFTDVRENKWYYNSVEYCAHKGYVNGTAPKTFNPEGVLTRSQFVTMLANLSGEDVSGYKNAVSPFKDVKMGKWYYPYVVWATQKGYSSGVGDGNFAPDTMITREQLARLFYSYAEINGYNVELRADMSGFKDAGSIAKWAHDEVRWCVAAGIISGKSGGLIDPKAPATRSQAATMMKAFDSFRGIK